MLIFNKFMINLNHIKCIIQLIYKYCSNFKIQFLLSTIFHQLIYNCYANWAVSQKILNYYYQSKKGFDKMSFFQCLAHLEKHFTDIIKYSGRYFFRLGNYKQCLSAKDMDYFYLEFGLKGTGESSIYYGSCLPAACSNKTVQTAFNYMFDKIGIPLQANTVHNHIQELSYPYGWPFYITVMLLCTLFSLVALATCSKMARQEKIVEAFSIQSTNKLFKYHEGSRLNVLNGVRSLAMLWVILGHEMSMPIGYSTNILNAEKSILSDWRFLVIEAGLYAVDTFYFVGGLLLGYAFMKDQFKSGMKYLIAIVNRYLRLVPSYFVAIMIFYGLIPHMGSGPFWEKSMTVVWDCHSLWRPLLFVDNLVQNGDHMCMGWGWYLQTDFQLFVYCIFILLIYSKSKMWGYFMIFLSMCFTFGYTMQQTFDHKYKWITHFSDAADSMQYQLEIYYKAWGRSPPYLYGLLLGLLYADFLAYQSKQNKKDQQILEQSIIHQKQPINKSQINKSQINSLNIQKQIKQNPPLLYQLKQRFSSYAWKRRAFEGAGLGICMFISFIPRTAQGVANHWPQFVHSFYLSYGKFGFVLGLSMMVLPSILLPAEKVIQNSNIKFSTFIRFIMDTKAFNFLAKVSFWTYLIHLTVLFVYFGTRFFDYYYAFLPSYIVFIASAVVSIFWGTVFVYLVQAPFTKIQKILINKLIKSRQAKNHKHIKNQSLNQNSIKDSIEKKTGGSGQ